MIGHSPTTYKPTILIKSSRVPFTRRRTEADIAYIAWLEARALERLGAAMESTGEVPEVEDGA